jgi:hypothetical protein
MRDCRIEARRNDGPAAPERVPGAGGTYETDTSGNWTREARPRRG